MATRIKDWEVPYVGWVGIEITNNHVINLLLREYNNLIHVDENNKVYVDLQLPDGIQPDDDFPVWVTTGKILEEDWWQQSWLILNWKTTSGDYARLIYANDWNVYIDCGDGIWRLLWEWGSLLNCNTRTFYLPELTDVSYTQQAYDYFLSWKNPILWYDRFGDGNHGEMFVYEEDSRVGADPYIMFAWTHLWGTSWESRWTAQLSENRIKVHVDPQDLNTVIRVEYIDWTLSQTWYSFIPAWINLRTPFMATYDSDPISKAYLDQELVKKQDVLTAGTRISITVDPNTGETIISADISWVFIYKWNVTDPTALPQSGNTVWDCWYSVSNQTLYAWDWTQWNPVGWTQIDLTNYFNKQTDTTDNITQWSTNLFVTQQEKDDWNAKQDQIQAWNNITIDADWVTINADPYTAWHWINIDGNKEVSNTLPFDPENVGTMWQYLVKTNDGYRWSNFPDVVTSVNGQHGSVTINEFDPENAGYTGQVLMKTQTWYKWQPAPWGWGWGTYYGGTGISIDNNNFINNDLPFDPSNAGSAWQVLKKTNNWYRWENESSWWTYYGGIWISIDSSNHINNDWVLTVNSHNPDSNGNINVNEVPWTGTTGYVLVKTQNGYEWQDKSFNPWAGTAGQVLTKTQNGYEWANAAEAWNVKLFTLNTSSTPASLSLTEAQAAWDWYKAWKLPILRAYGTHSYVDTAGTTHNMTGWWDYYPEPSETGAWLFTFTTHHDTYDGYEIQSNYWYTEQHDYIITLTISNDTTVTAVNSWNQTAAWTQFLSPWVNYATPYTPQYPWSPATKKYVDDRAVVSSTAPANPHAWDLWYDTTATELKVYTGSAWVSVWWGWGGWHDYSWHTLTGTSLSLTGTNYRNVISTSSNVTVSAWTGLTPWLSYILRITNTDYSNDKTMTYWWQSYIVPAWASVNFYFLCLDATTLDFEWPRYVDALPNNPDEWKQYFII